MFLNLGSINKKISLVFILTIVMLVLASNIGLYFVFRNITFNRIINDQNNIIHQSKINIENLANNVNQATVYLYTDKSIGEFLNKKPDDPINKIYDLSILKDTFTNYVNAPISSAFNTYFAVLYIYDNFPIADELKTSKLDNNIEGLNGIFSAKEVCKEEWFINTVKLNGALNTFILANDKSKVYISRLIRNKYIFHQKNLDAMGVVVIGIDLKYFANQIEGTKLTKSTRIMLVNNDKKVIYSNDNGLIGNSITTYPLANSINKMKINQPSTITYKGDKYLSSIYTLHWGWNLVAFIPYNDIYAEIGLIKSIIFIETLICILIGIIITLMLSKSISDPIKRLAEVMKRIKNEDSIDVNIDTGYKDEVGVLYDSFNTMMRRIGKLLADVYESNRKQRDAELKTLQAQINPHFVYNTLDSINWMALCKNEEDISSMTISLAYIMRYSIKNPDEMVEISEEIECVRCYASIQAIRYDNNFDIKYEIEFNMLKIKIPKFIIQPLVENAIVHGTEKSSDRGLITISSSELKDRIEIVVSDNGAGTEADILNKYLAGEKTSLLDSDGFGIKNINERLKMNFGEKYVLRYKRNFDLGISAILTIPLKKE